MPITGFNALTVIPEQRAQHHAVVVNGKIYVFGGYNSASGYIQPELRVYNISTGAWESSTTFSPSRARSYHSMVVYNGDIYIYGGNDATGTQLLKYVITTNTLTVHNTAGTSRKRHGSCVYNDSMYIIGGGTIDDPTTITVLIYNFSSNSWLTGAIYTPNNSQRSTADAVRYLNKIYMVESVRTPSSSYNQLLEYNIDTNIWTQKATFQPGGYSTESHTHGMISDDNGKLYFFGGRQLDNYAFKGWNDYIWIYDISTNTWTQSIQDTVNSLTGELALVFNNGIIYRIGGWNNTGADNFSAVMRSTSGLVNAKGSWQTLPTSPTSGKQYIYDYKLTLNERIETPLSDEDLFTQVIARGTDADPPNYSLAATVVLNQTDTGGVIGNIIDYKLDTEIIWEVHDNMPAEGTVMATITLNQIARLSRVDVLAGSFEGNLITEGIEIEFAGTDGIWVKPSKSAGIQIVSSGTWAQFNNDDFKNMEIQKIRILGQQWYNEFDITTDRDLFGTDILYQSNWQFSIAEVQIWGEEELYGYANLDNCFSSDTEIMTEKGWVLLRDIVEKREKIKVATLNPNTKKVEYFYPKNYIKNFYEDNMITFRNRFGINLCVTPNHNIYYRTPKNKNWLIQSADYVSNLFSFYIYRKFSEYNEKKPVSYITIGRQKYNIDLFLKFLGLYISEGNFINISTYYKYKRIKNFGKISLRKDLCITQKKKEIVEEINQILNKMGLIFSEQKKNKDYSQFIIHDRNLFYFCFPLGKASQKFIPQEIKNLHPEKLKILFDYLIKGNGTKKYNYISYTTISEQLARDIDEIGLKIGYVTHRRKIINKNPKNHDYYTITFYKNDFSRLQKNKSIIKKEYYKDFVYCLNMPPYHLIYVRRQNGSGCWCGNCIGVGDDSTKIFYIPNVPYGVKDTATGGSFGWNRKSVTNVTIYKNSLSTILTGGGVDYTLDATTGKVTFVTAPAKGDVIAASYTLDSNDSTMVYTASFAHKTLLQRVGLRAFKDDLDEGLDTHKKVIQRADKILPEVARLNLSLNAKVVYRPDVKIGDTVLVESIVSGVTRKYFVEELTENKDGISPSLDFGMVNFE